MMETSIENSNIAPILAKKVISDNKLASLKTTKKLTWQALQNMIQRLNGERRQDNVTVYLKVQDEYYSVDSVCFANKDNGVLDEGHLILTINESGEAEKPDAKKVTG